MKQHTTNYKNTFIEIADDSPLQEGEVPSLKGGKHTIASMQYDIVSKNPYKFTSDDVLFQVYAERKEIPKSEYKRAREEYFSKGQPCFRASPLTKRYGWGLHCDNEGKIALYSAESEEYCRYIEDETIDKVKAMKSKR